MERVDGKPEAIFEGVSGAGCPADETCENVSQLARDLGVDRTCLYAWKRKLGRGPYHHGRTTVADWRDARIEELQAPRP